ncbi:hypothetical protein [Nonomuraea gerenzanensis]|uniref:Uncharacterized protein n=1 Tax=Nonomuraea gerenzanensis TaxID=93944 RepID=A0A1M4EBT4_9ACTN|nr:hypothetical protein [Nonomuraea gerenzanensis]UBU18564.1 hypothetical protein LCN96_27145 [Nonomuraea gerenzanensis]SBO96407.1 hypothetical protein BN4615_P5923 [Nonomuraea gerenzanensis]
MNADWDGTFVAKSVVDRGISAWSTNAEEVSRELPKLIGEVESCLAAAPWGVGKEGYAFYEAHFRDGGPRELINQCKRLAEEIVDVGDRLRQAIDNTRLTDADLDLDLTRMTREI